MTPPTLTSAPLTIEHEIHGPKGLALIVQGPEGRFLQLHKSGGKKSFQAKATRIDWTKYPHMTLLEVARKVVFGSGRIAVKV